MMIRYALIGEAPRFFVLRQIDDGPIESFGPVKTGDHRDGVYNFLRAIELSMRARDAVGVLRDDYDRLSSQLLAAAKAAFGGSSNGRTADSDSASLGSNPSPPANCDGVSEAIEPACKAGGRG